MTWNSSGFGAAMNFHPPDRIARSGAQPNSTSGANDLGVELALRRLLRPLNAGDRSMPSTSGGAHRPERAHRRRDVGQRHRGRRSQCPADVPGPRDQQRHAQRRVVDEDAVADFAVLAERLAVIAGGTTTVFAAAGPSAAISRPASRSAAAISSS